MRASKETRLEPAKGLADADLVAGARTGDAEAYDGLYRRHRDSVTRTAFLLGRDVDLAQDIVQEAFLVGWRNLGSLRDPGLFRAWVTGIAVNLARRRRGVLRILPGPSAEPLPAEISAPQSDDPDLRVTVRAAVSALPSRLREALVLRFYGGFTEPEIAAALAVPLGTVKSRLSRARSQLAAALGTEVE